MKKILIIITFFILSPFISFSQILVEKSIGGELDISNQQFTIKINNEVVSGILTENNVKKLRFYTIEINDKILIVRLGKTLQTVDSEMDLIKLKSLETTNILDIYYLKESYKTIKKTIKKTQFEGLKTLNVIFSSNNYGGVWRDKIEVEKEEKIKEYDKKTELKNYIETYKIKIIKSASITMSSDSYGKLIVTQEGITIKTEIPAINLISSKHDKTSQFNNPSKGIFWCKNLKGDKVLEESNGMIVKFNEHSGGSFTILFGRNKDTTSFIIVEERVNMNELRYDNRSYYYQDRLYTGIGFATHGDRTLKEIGNIKKGEKLGLWKKYYSNGNLKSEENYEYYGWKVGLWKSYYKNGNLKSEENYRYGSKTGLWKYYYENGKLKSEENYKDGSKVGLWKMYYKNGNLKSEENHKDDPVKLQEKRHINDYKAKIHRKNDIEFTRGKEIGIQNGKCNYYYENGQLEEEIIYIDGLVSESKKYTEKGELFLEVNDGVFKYYSNGKLIREGLKPLTLENNDRYSYKKEGVWKYYNESGALYSEGGYKNNRKNGLWRWYYENGVKKIEATYSDGHQEGIKRLYYKNGNLRSEFSVYINEFDGLYKSYYENGQLEDDGFYIDDKRNGLWKYYYENGQLEKEGNYKDGQRDGTWSVYNENGQLKEEGNYFLDKKNGVWKHYHKEQSYEYNYDNGQIID